MPQLYSSVLIGTEHAGHVIAATFPPDQNRSRAYPGGEMLREKFGDRARLVSVEGSGHGVYVLGGNACAWNTTTSYLSTARCPSVTCPAAPPEA